MANAEPTPEHLDDEMDNPGPQVSLREYVDVRIADLKESINDRLKALAEAVTVAKVEHERRLTEMNQFREQIKSERADFATREYVDQEVKALATRLSRVEYGGTRDPGGAASGD